MNKHAISAEREIASYFNGGDALPASESDVIKAIVTELLQSNEVVSNKAIMANLIDKLESETDVIKLDIYRHALESLMLNSREAMFARS
ncbi:biofilm development regulator YmgB/AriR family protein [Nissabacter sp. SGAir0207]|uniref:biofilm development regulator YmgB/AriR family protein n=1 Tax=Nissabacter sp. SGAir0207 TaxID=2126321 RepID=UPI0010CCC2F9|nr:biofilm development regulator YmgB/AriR family protein [Nissabacter sp. SGAir0207]QCR35838.1 biofilm development protein AriR [Nissabacter sp. SGAir0207]